MRIISKKRLDSFLVKHGKSRAVFEAWYNIVKNCSFSDFVELREIFPHADQVKNSKGKILTVFNIGGNKFRLITAIHYNTGKVFIRDILTHAEYDKNYWK